MKKSIRAKERKNISKNMLAIIFNLCTYDLCSYAPMETKEERDALWT